MPRPRHNPPPARLPKLDVEDIVHHGSTGLLRAIAYIYRYDFVIKRRLELQGKIAARTGGGKRGQVLQFSDKARRFLRFYLRNIGVRLCVFATLTYPPGLCPQSGEDAKRHLDRMTTWLRRRDIRGIWRLQFMVENWMPHFHLFMTGWIDAEKLRAQWSRIITNYKTDAEPVVVKVQPITFGKMLGYATKRSIQDDAPDWFIKPGNRWGQFGLGKLPREAVTGTPQELSGLVRATKRAVASRKKRGRRLLQIDKGRNSYTLLGGAKPARAYQKWIAKSQTETAKTPEK